MCLEWIIFKASPASQTSGAIYDSQECAASSNRRFGLLLVLTIELPGLKCAHFDMHSSGSAGIMFAARVCSRKSQTNIGLHTPSATKNSPSGFAADGRNVRSFYKLTNARPFVCSVLVVFCLRCVIFYLLAAFAVSLCVSDRPPLLFFGRTARTTHRHRTRAANQIVRYFVGTNTKK